MSRCRAYASLMPGKPKVTLLRQQDLDLMISLLRPKVNLGDGERQNTPSELIRAWDKQRRHYEASSAKGDAVASVVLKLTPADWSGLDDLLAKGLKKLDAEPTPSALDKLASDALEDGHHQDAALLLAIRLPLTNAKPDIADSLSSLALCGVSMGQFDDALILAKECLAIEPAHPRAHCIAGLCQLQSGNRKMAQTSLALAARIARANPDYAEPLQAAQRLLLILHFED